MEIGKVINAKYELIDSLDEGEEYEIWLGKDLSNEQKYCLKFPKINNEQFLNDFKNTKFFDHSNIIKTFGIESFEDRPFSVMEYVSGITLKQLINFCKKNKIEIPFSFSLVIIKKILTILNFIVDNEEKAFFLQKLEPENILLTKYLEVKLFDFGVGVSKEGAFNRDEGESSNDFYLSPEFNESGYYDESDEVFRIGLLLKELVNLGPLKINEFDLGDFNRVNEIVSFINFWLGQGSFNQFFSMKEILELHEIYDIERWLFPDEEYPELYQHNHEYKKDEIDEGIIFFEYKELKNFVDQNHLFNQKGFVLEIGVQESENKYKIFELFRLLSQDKLTEFLHNIKIENNKCYIIMNDALEKSKKINRKKKFELLYYGFELFLSLFIIFIPSIKLKEKIQSTFPKLANWTSNRDKFFNKNKSCLPKIIHWKRTVRHNSKKQQVELKPFIERINVLFGDYYGPKIMPLSEKIDIFIMFTIFTTIFSWILNYCYLNLREYFFYWGVGILITLSIFIIYIAIVLFTFFTVTKFLNNIFLKYGIKLDELNLTFENELGGRILRNTKTGEILELYKKESLLERICFKNSRGQKTGPYVGFFMHLFEAGFFLTFSYLNIFPLFYLILIEGFNFQKCRAKMEEKINRITLDIENNTNDRLKIYEILAEVSSMKTSNTNRISLLKN